MMMLWRDQLFIEGHHRCQDVIVSTPTVEVWVHHCACIEDGDYLSKQISNICSYEYSKNATIKIVKSSPVSLLSVVFNNHLSFFLRKNSKRRASSPAGPAVPNAPETVFQPSLGWPPTHFFVDHFLVRLFTSEKQVKWRKTMVSGRLEGEKRFLQT